MIPVFDVRAEKAKKRTPRNFFKQLIYGRNVLNLRPKFKFRHPVVWTLALLIVLVGGFFALHNFSTKADVKDFYPSTCLGDWQWTSNAQGKPDTLIAPSSSFSPANSAMYDATGTEIYCGGFLPADYDGTGTITSVGVTLVWQVGDGTPSSSSSGSDTVIVSSTTEDSGGASTGIATTTIAASTMTAASPTDATTTIATTTESVATTTEDTATTTDEGSSTIAATSTTASSLAPEVEPTSTLAPMATPSSSDSTVDTSASSSAFLFMRSLFAQLVHPALADGTSTDAGTDIDTSTIIAPPTEQTSSASSTTSITDASDTLALPPPPVPDDNFLQVSYSVDGQNWIALRGVNLSNWPNLTLAIPIVQWADLQNLQIRIDDMPTTQSPIPSVFLDGMFVEVQYDVAASADGGPAPIYTDFTTDKTTYVQGDLAQVTGAPAGSSIEIYSLDNFDAPGEPEHVYATQLDNTGGTTIDINTLTPGRYALVNTFDPGACNQYSLQDCEARTDFISEEDIMVVPPLTGAVLAPGS